jgi:predicted dehydrogenase
MRDAADANRVQLMEAFMYRFHPRTEAVLERVHAGALGTLTSINAHFGFRLTRPVNIRWNAELGGGAAMDVGCYCISAIRTLAGAEPVEVSARATWTDSGVDATLTGWIAFASGLVAHFGCSMAGERRELLEIIGTDAMFSIESAFVPGTGETEYVERRGGDVSRHVAAGANQYARMVEHFTDAVQLGTPLRYPASDGEANTAVIEALLRSARAEGRPERVATV